MSIIPNAQQTIAEEQSEPLSEVRTDVTTGHRSLFSKKVFHPDDVISHFYWEEVRNTPTYLTVQIGEDRHVELLPTYLECANHSCHPNAFFDTTKKQLVCIRPIQVAEEITFFYPSAEWDMDQPFDCHCKSSECIGHIAGAKYLSPDQTQHYRFTDFIRQKLHASN